MEQIYYIPTSTYNFISLVSSESFSPANYYVQKFLGAKNISFVDIFNGQFRSNIILSDQLCMFTRLPSDVEDHPMVIEVRLDESEVTPLGDGFYSTDKTIYITPYNCRFLFFTEQDRLVTESLSEHSLDVKLSDLYIPRMAIVQPSGEYDFSKIMIKDAVVSGETSAVDERLNRLKGMLYGYYIGSMLSTSKEEVEKLRILQEVQNEFSAIISSGAKYLSTEKEGRLRELSMRWEQFSPLYIELTREGYDVKKLNSILRKYGARLPINNLGLSHYTIYLTQQPVEGIKNPAMEWIEREIEIQSNSLLRYGKKINPEDGAIITNGVNVINIQISDHVELVKHWLNTLLLDSKQTARDSYSKMELADMVTDSTIDFMGNNWKESVERVFLNKLRKHIAGEAFDVEWDNGALCSMAAVVLRGDEWDTLLSFMQRKGMYDYRLAFALYGALTGYANMTRDFVDMLFEDKNYGLQVYKEFYGQLLGKDLAPSLNATPTPIKEIIPEDKDTQTGETVPEPIKNNEVNRIVAAIRNHPDFKEKYEKNIKTIEEEGLTNWDDIEKKAKWKTFIQKVRPDKPTAKRAPKKQKEATYTQGTLFANPTSLFRDDDNVWEAIVDCIPEDNRLHYYGMDRLPKKDCIHKDLNWYQKMMRLPQSERGYKTKNGWKSYKQDLDSSNNREVILGFCEMRRGESWWDGCREIIKERLLSLYCRND